MKYQIYLYICLLILINKSLELRTNIFNDDDPFAILGIKSIDKAQILEKVEKSEHKTNSNIKKKYPKLKTIEDLPTFLKHAELNEDEALNILTKFLIQDDIKLKKYGAIFDETGFDGLNPIEPISAEGTEERLNQRARSAANIYYRSKHTDPTFDSYKSDEDYSEKIEGWRIYKVLLINKDGDSSNIKVCLPEDESLPALCSLNINDKCYLRIEYVKKQKKENNDYIKKIKNGNFFKKKNKALNNSSNINNKLDKTKINDTNLYKLI